MTNRTMKCDVCGRFVSLDDLMEGTGASAQACSPLGRVGLPPPLSVTLALIDEGKVTATFTSGLS
jgi:hypothetical protein